MHYYSPMETKKTSKNLLRITKDAVLLDAENVGPGVYGKTGTAVFSNGTKSKGLKKDFLWAESRKKVISDVMDDRKLLSDHRADAGECKRSTKFF